MEKKNSIFFVLFFVVLLEAIPNLSSSQTKDTFQLVEINISPRLNDFSITQNIRKSDTLFLNANTTNNIGRFLQQENSIFIKSYGPSSAATTSIRGGNASQTAVTWNGFNIKNAMLGQNDLSILTTFFADEISLQYGGSTAMWGSGAVAGAIHLRNDIKFNRGMETGLIFSNASYRNNSFGLKASFSDKKFSTTTRLFQRSGKNNFQFTDADGNNRNMPHAEAVQYGILHEDHFKIKTNQLVSLRYWAQLTDRNLPPSLQQSVSKSFQSDDFNRVSLEYQLKKENFKLQLRNGFFAERLNYSDSIATLYSHSSLVTNISEAEFIYSKNKQNKFQGGINNTIASAKTESYSSRVSQDYLSLFGGYMLQSKNEKHALTFNAREEYTKNKFQPFTASLAFVSNLFSWMELKGSTSKLYRLPTFNDLYWNPGGNLNLRPEEGYSEDLSLKFKKYLLSRDSATALTGEVQGTIFSRQMKNWIIWLPGANGIWTPQNLMQVWSRGLETNSSITFSFRKFVSKIFLNTNYVLSTNQKSKTENDESIGRQLIYTPVYSGAAGIQIKYRRFYFSYSHTYTGYRYLTSDNYSYLNPYDLGNFLAGYGFLIKETAMDLSLQINNAWNTSYMVMAQRPMPRANYSFTLKINFLKSKNK